MTSSTDSGSDNDESVWSNLKTNKTFDGKLN